MVGGGRQRRPRIGAVVCDRSVSANVRSDFDIFCIRLPLVAKSRFPAGETDLNGDLVRLRHLLRRKAKHLVLPGPLQGKVGKSSDSYSVWQSTLDGGLDEIGCKEGHRDHHVDLSGATPFPFCNGLGIRRCVSDQFIEPVTPALSSKNRLVPGVGVCDAIYREFLFGRGPCAWGELPSSPFSSVGRVCSRCYRKRSRNFVASRLSYDTTRRILDFTASDSAECWYF